MGICGPVSEDGSVDAMVCLMHWGRLEEKNIEKETGISKIKLINDFVANGYGIEGVLKQDLLCIYQPNSASIVENKMKLLIGIGTSLGVCFIARETE